MQRGCRLQESNEYLEGLKSFSESVKQQFKIHSIPAEQLKPIEESMKQLVREVKGIGNLQQINDIKRKKINAQLIDIAQKVIDALPRTQTTIDIFSSLRSFEKLMGVDAIENLESIQRILDGSKRIYQRAPDENFQIKNLDRMHMPEKKGGPTVTQSPPSIIPPPRVSKGDETKEIPVSKTKR
jgi:hypothetical protein